MYRGRPQGQRSLLLELKTWRYRAHFQGEPAAYRTKEEEAEWIKKDPLGIARAELGALKLLDGARAGAIEGEVKAELARAVDFARSSPDPEPEDALLDVFA